MAEGGPQGFGVHADRVDAEHHRALREGAGLLLLSHGRQHAHREATGAGGPVQHARRRLSLPAHDARGRAGHQPDRRRPRDSVRPRLEPVCGHPGARAVLAHWAEEAGDGVPADHERDD